MSAHADVTGSGSGSLGKKTTGSDGIVRAGEAAAKAANNAGKAAGDAAKDAGDKAKKAAKDASDEAKKETDEALNNFQEWLGKLFDWIEVRLSRIRWKIDYATKKSENAVGYQNKNAELGTAMNQISSVNGHETYSLQTKTGLDGVERVTGVNIQNGGGKGTLINNELRGAKKYFNQANKVKKKAVKSGVVSEKKAEKLIEKIQSGDIDITKYDEKTQEFIKDYQMYYEKALDAVSATEDLKSEFKDLQQQKLDNIVEQFNAITGIMEEQCNIAKTTMEYYQVIGTAVNSSSMSGSIQQQMGLTSQLMGVIQQGYSAYTNEMANAAATFGTDSVEYFNAQLQLAQLQSQYANAQLQMAELNDQLLRLDMERAQLEVDRYKAYSSRLNEITNYGEARGTLQRDNGYNPYLNESRFMDQFNSNMTQIAAYENLIREQENLIANAGYEIGSEKWNEAYQSIEQAEQAIIQLSSACEQLRDSIRKVRWEPFKRFAEQLNNTMSDLDDLRSFITDAELFNEDASITDRGYANIALIAQSMGIAKQQIADYQRALEKVQQEYDNGNISLEEYNQESREYIENLKAATQANRNYIQSLVDMYETQKQKETDLLLELIDKRKKALAAKKAYYDYDRQLRNKRKDLIQLQSEIKALEGVQNEAGKAELARLRAEFSEANDDLVDFRFQHQIEMQQSGYDKLAEDAKETLEDILEAINRDATKQQQISTLMISSLRDNTQQAMNGVNSVVRQTGVSITQGIAKSITALQDITNRMSMLNGEQVDQMINIATNVAQASFEIQSVITDGIRAVESIALQNAINDTGGAAAEANAGSGGGDTGGLQSLSAEPTIVIDESVPADEEVDLEAINAAVNADIDDMIMDVTGGKKKKKKKKKNNDIGIVVVGHKKGTMSASEGPAWTNEGWENIGPEMIVRKRDGAILTPLSAGDAVIPANFTKNLFKWGALDPAEFFARQQVSQQIDRSMTINDHSTVNIHYDSLINVQGSVDESVMPDLKEIVQRSYEYTSKQLMREGRKMGWR